VVRLTLLVTAAVLGAGGVGAEGPRPELAVTSLEVDVLGPRRAVVRWETTEPARSLVAYGTSTELGLWKRGSRVLSLQHWVVLDGLAFDARHWLEVVASAEDESAAVVTSFETPPLTRPRLETEGRTLLLDGDPFLPLLQHQQCPETVEPSLALGFTVFSGPCSHSEPEAVVEAVGGRAVVLLPPGGVGDGYSLPDEPDDNGITPEELRERLRDGGERPAFLTLTAKFLHRDEAVYREYADVGHVLGFDLYPINRCRRDRLHEVYEAQVRFEELARGKPTFQWIETGLIRPDYCGGDQPTPEELRAEVFLALAGGARGIGYFTHTWSPEYDRLDLGAAVAVEVRQTSRQLEALAPAILSAQAPTATASAPGVFAFAREREGALYVFLVNATRERIETSVAVPGLGGRTLRVFEEGQTVASRGDGFVDVLAPLDARIYIAPPPGA
jgi:hypothetical protein